jgi:hypothetical protein
MAEEWPLRAGFGVSLWSNGPRIGAQSTPPQSIPAAVVAPHRRLLAQSMSAANARAAAGSREVVLSRLCPVAAVLPRPQRRPATRPCPSDSSRRVVKLTYSSATRDGWRARGMRRLQPPRACLVTPWRAVQICPRATASLCNHGGIFARVLAREPTGRLERSA